MGRRIYTATKKDLCIPTYVYEQVHTPLQKEKYTQMYKHSYTSSLKEFTNRSKQVGGWIDVNMAAEMYTKDSNNL